MVDNRCIQKILKLSYPGDQNPKGLPLRALKALDSLKACRTIKMGGKKVFCKDGHFEKHHFYSCRHRLCSLCNHAKKIQWLEDQKRRLLDCNHFHVIFTIDHELNTLWFWNRKIFQDIIFKATQRTLFEMLKDKKHLGAKPGIMIALHTWGQNLNKHLHTHALVTAGGIKQNGKWKKLKNKSFLLYGKAVANKFRGKFCALLLKKYRAGELVTPDPKVFGDVSHAIQKSMRKQWHVEVMKPYKHGNGVAAYLAKYMKGGPINKNRISDFNSNEVTFSYKQNKTGNRDEKVPIKNKTLTPKQFSELLLFHTPLPNTQTIRSYGVYSNKSNLLEHVRKQLNLKPYVKPPKDQWKKIMKISDNHKNICPQCQKPLETVLFPPGKDIEPVKKIA